MSPKSISVAELAEYLGLSCHGDGGRILKRAAPLEEASGDALTFCEKSGQLERLSERPGAVILAEPLDGWTCLISPQPRVAFARALACMYPEPAPPPGVHPTASVAPDAFLEAGASVGPFCLVESGARVGAGTVLRAHVRVGRNARIGENCRIEPHCSVAESSEIGDQCVLEPHSRLLTGTRLGRAVYLGSRCVLRGCEIADGCKIDNLAMVCEGAQVGPHTLLISQCLIQPGAVLGRYCVIAAQAVIDRDVRLADQVQVAGRSWVRESVDQKGSALAGEPAVEYAAEMRLRALRSRLGR